MRDMPAYFVCDACAERQHLDLLYTATSDAVSLYCVQCCGCEVHGSAEVEGTIVHPWRGLTGSEHRTRRHQ